MKKTGFTPRELATELNNILQTQTRVGFTGSVTMCVHFRDGSIGSVNVKTEQKLHPKKNIDNPTLCNI